MKEIKVKTIWMGKIGVRDKFINKAIENNEDLCFLKGDDYMIIPWDDIREKIVGKSENPVFDKFKGEYHYLIYFNWKPTTKQQKLL